MRVTFRSYFAGRRCRNSSAQLRTTTMLRRRCGGGPRQCGSHLVSSRILARCPAIHNERMGRIVVPVRIRNPLHAEKEMLCDALVDTGASGLVLPSAWRDRLSPFAKSRRVKLETADQRVIEGEICGPVEVQIEGFDPVFNEVTFVSSEPEDGAYEALVGYILLEQSRAAVDLVGHRLLPVKTFDLKRCRHVMPIAECTLP